jgi:hypothetical protein
MSALFGALEPVRIWVLARALPIHAGDASLSVVLHWPAWLLPAAVGSACLAGVLLTGQWRDHKGTVIAGVLIGILVVAGWWVTGFLGVDDLDPRPPTSLAVAGPLARSAAWLSMGVSTESVFTLLLIPGILVGALVAAILSGEFRWVAPASDRVAAYLGGGALMGVGAQLAGGCNIGQGLSGAATLSVTSLLAVGGILGGMVLGLQLVRR